MLIFASPTQLALLCLCRIIISDGTFKFAPAGTVQIYRIFGVIVIYLIENKEQSWVKYFGGIDGVEEYEKVYSKLGEWGSSIQLLLAAKRYNYNFVLFQPETAPRFVTYYVDKEPGDPATEIGLIRYRGEEGTLRRHFDVAQFGMKFV